MDNVIQGDCAGKHCDVCSVHAERIYRDTVSFLFLKSFTTTSTQNDKNRNVSAPLVLEAQRQALSSMQEDV